jgi:uncharacterized DUF497 family protein
VKYERDPAKAEENVRKHRVRFEEAVSVFLILSVAILADNCSA